MACSGLLWVFALRDFLATGRVIAGSWDYAMQVCLTLNNENVISILNPFTHTAAIFRCLQNRPSFSIMPRDGSLNRAA